MPGSQPAPQKWKLWSNKWGWSFQHIEIHNIEAVSSFTYVGTELMRENKEEVERHNRQISKQGITLNLWLAHWKLNSEYTRIYIAIKLNIQDLNWTNTKLRLQSVNYDSVFRRKTSSIWRRIFGTDIWWRLSHNKELSELLDVHDSVKYWYIQFEKLQWIHLLVWMHIRILK
jgi:hypothetical protein